MSDPVAIGAYAKKRPEKECLPQSDVEGSHQTSGESSSAWQLQTEVPESTSVPVPSALDLAVGLYGVIAAGECDGAGQSTEVGNGGVGSVVPPYDPMADARAALAGAGTHPDGQFHALTVYYSALGGAPQARQTEVIAAVSEHTSSDVALRFSEWLAMGPSDPYQRAMTIGRGPLGAQGATIFGPLAVAAAPDALIAVAEFGMGVSDRGHAFVDGFVEQARAQLPPETLEAVLDKLSKGALANTVFSPIFAVGALHGAAAELGDLLKLVGNLPEVVAGLQTMLGALLGPDGAAASFALGADLGLAMGGDIASVAAMELPAVCYWMGKKAGPLLAEILVAFVTGGAAVLARRSFHLVSAMMEGVDALGTLRRGWTAVKSQMDVDLGGPLLADGPGVVPDRSSTSTGPRDQAHVDALMGRGPDNQPLRADADSNGAGEAAVRNPKLARLVGREVTPDNFDMLRIEFYEQGYHLSMDADGFVRIRRHDGRRSELPSLMYDVETGLIREGVEGSNRISRSGRLRRNLAEQAGRPEVLPDHVAHHLVPDEVVRKHPLFDAARRRGDPPYDLDDASNGVELRRSPDVEGDVNMPTHSGSHPRWNAKAEELANQAVEALEDVYGTLDDVPAERLTAAARSIEDDLRVLLSRPEMMTEMGRIR
jgi:hypothetical protein